jgi:peptidoglycan/xylan/chitin deacetylase (PgdA/CDA1 family)
MKAFPRLRWPWLVGAGVGLAAASGLIVLAVNVKEDARVINHGPRDRPQIALTFDADLTRTMAARLSSGQVGSHYDPAIVRELQETRTPATFFVTGLWAMTYPGVVRLLAGDPLFEIENHSVDHAAFTAKCFGLPVIPSESMKRWEIARTATVLRDIAGVTPRYFRFPGGCYEEGDLQIVRSLGHQAVGWDVISGDAFEPHPAVIVQNVLDKVQPGSIIVMHLNGAPHAPATASALRTLIPALRTRGLRFVTLRELLGSRTIESETASPVGR